ncbi:uncharacterized protein LOC115332015 [Ixodes scapularis]|uniref:uncharacterized protein LOC115332015 n=1 Tax=Ixodes scapularis TaxID=6945 RepID=UPI001C392C43|nr:uncharacterized protein LOC115332015 [Ixodes scapularis]
MCYGVHSYLVTLFAPPVVSGKTHLKLKKNASYKNALPRCYTSNIMVFTVHFAWVILIYSSEFQGQVLRLLNVIKLILQQVASTLDALTASSEPTAAPNPVVPQPFDTADGLSNIEADLSASDEALLVKELIQLGGRNPNTATKRMLAYLLTDKLAAEYSWEGKKEKKSCKLRICQLMCAAVNKRFTQSTKDDVEVTTKSWLRHAPEREFGKASQR